MLNESQKIVLHYIDDVIPKNILSEELSTKYIKIYIAEGYEDKDFDKLLEEGLLNVVLDVVGLIPGVGEPADITNAILYAKNGEFLNAAFSLVSLIPVVGDAIGKGGKYLIQIAKSAKVAKIGSLGVKVGTLVTKAATSIKKNENLIKGLLEKMSENKAIAKYVEPIKRAIADFVNKHYSEQQPVTEGAKTKKAKNKFLGVGVNPVSMVNKVAAAAAGTPTPTPTPTTALTPETKANINALLAKMQQDPNEVKTYSLAVNYLSSLIKQNAMKNSKKKVNEEYDEKRFKLERNFQNILDKAEALKDEDRNYLSLLRTKLSKMNKEEIDILKSYIRDEYDGSIKITDIARVIRAS